jgi:nucleolar protein 58
LLLFAPEHIFYQTVWLNEFQTFDDKSSAINVDTGVDEKLTKMICHCPKKKLLVGKPKYKSIIEKSLVSMLLVCLNA